MAALSNQQNPDNTENVWRKRFWTACTLLVWLALGGIVFWLLAQISEALVTLGIAMLIAYALYPLVKILQRFLHLDTLSAYIRWYQLVLC